MTHCAILPQNVASLIKEPESLMKFYECKKPIHINPKIFLTVKEERHEGSLERTHLESNT